MTTELRDHPLTSEPEFQYRSVSLLSVLALVLGLFSVVALLSPVGWVVPAAGAIVSILAAFRVHRNADRFTGKNIAILGICVSLWLGAWAPTKYFVDRHYLASQSSAFTVEWLKAVVDADLEKAHQGTLEFRYRQPKGTDLKAHYESSDIDRTDMTEYFGHGLVKDIVSRPSNTVIELDRVRTITREKNGARNVVNIFKVDPPDGEPISIAIEAIRDKYKGKFYWRVSGAADPVSLFGEEG